MVAAIRKNPLVPAAVFTAGIFYAFLALGKPLPCRSRPFSCLLSPSEIVMLEGRVASNPVKTAGAFYRFSFLPENGWDKSGAASTCRGQVQVFLSQELVEGLYPGKSYTQALSAAALPASPLTAASSPLSLAQAASLPLLIETGARLRLSTRFFERKGREAFFFASGLSPLGWERSPAAGFMRLRAISRLSFKRLMYSWQEAGGLVLALLSGSREYLDPALAAAFAAAGLSHLLALSGMHLTLIAGFSQGLLRHFFPRRLSAFFQLLAVCLFIWFAGISPSLLRSFFCLVILYVCELLHLSRPKLLTLLSGSFLLHLACAPDHAYQLAFMLSYSALAGIALAAGGFHHFFASRGLPAARPFSESLSAQTATLPFSLVIFSRFAPAGVFACLLASPLTGLFLYAALLGIIISLFFPFLSPLVCAIMRAGYAVLKALVLFFGRLPAITFRDSF